jgi:CO dehydrogenase/acetyl-CoA synthase epsilon subunit
MTLKQIRKTLGHEKVGIAFKIVYDLLILFGQLVYIISRILGLIHNLSVVRNDARGIQAIYIQPQGCLLVSPNMYY